MNNLLDYTLDELKVWMSENGESAFRGKTNIIVDLQRGNGF